MQEPQTTQCSNCKQKIPNQKFDLHDSYCSRYNILCPVCGDVYDKRSQSDHPDLHKTVSCPICKSQMEKKLLEDHERVCGRKNQADGADSKPVFFCEFCDHEIELRMLEEHVEMCGSRTDECMQCHKLIKKSEMGIHLSLCTGENEESQQAVKRRAKAAAPTLSDLIDEDERPLRGGRRRGIIVNNGKPAPKEHQQEAQEEQEQQQYIPTNRLDQYIKSKGPLVNRRIRSLRQPAQKNAPAKNKKSNLNKVVEVRSESEQSKLHESDIDFIDDREVESEEEDNYKPAFKKVTRANASNNNNSTKNQPKNNNAAQLAEADQEFDFEEAIKRSLQQK